MLRRIHGREGYPIELIDGQLVVAELHGAYHASEIPRVDYAGQDPTAALGWRYRSVSVLGPGDTIAPFALPSRRVAVADLLP